LFNIKINDTLFYLSDIAERLNLLKI